MSPTNSFKGTRESQCTVTQQMCLQALFEGIKRLYISYMTGEQIPQNRVNLAEGPVPNGDQIRSRNLYKALCARLKSFLWFIWDKHLLQI